MNSAELDIFKAPETRLTLQKLLGETKKKSDFQRLQCIWLRIEFDMNSEQIAKATNLKPGTVRQIWSRFRKSGYSGIYCKDKGGRKHYHLSIDEERLFLSPFFKKAETTGKIMVNDLKLAFENRIGQPVPKSTIYRLLKRHGWKKGPRRNIVTEERDIHKNPDMHDYWIEGCSQAILPRRPGNISQQWLNSTLNSLAGS